MSNMTSIIKEDKIMINKPSGIYTEKKLTELLVENFPLLEVQHIGQAMARSGDIHVIDHNNKNFYIIECKDKKTIVKSDLEVFDKTISSFKYEDYNIIGIFISFNCSIPEHGNYNIIENKIYITKDYVSKEIFSMIFTFYIIKERKEITAPSDETMKILTAINSEYSMLNSFISINNEIIKNHNNNIGLLTGINNELLPQMKIIKSLLSSSGYIGDNIDDMLEEEIIKNNSITKTQLLAKFKDHMHYISNLDIKLLKKDIKTRHQVKEKLQETVSPVKKNKK